MYEIINFNQKLNFFKKLIKQLIKFYFDKILKNESIIINKVIKFLC